MAAVASAPGAVKAAVWKSGSEVRAPWASRAAFGAFARLGPAMHCC